MSISHIDLHVAKAKMRLKDTTFCLSFVSTVLRGEVIMCMYNNMQKEISNIFCTQIINPNEFKQLETLIQEFMGGT